MWILVEDQSGRLVSQSNASIDNAPAGFTVIGPLDVDLSTNYWDTDTRRFLPLPVLPRDAVITSWDTSNRNLITGQQIQSALTDLAALEQNGITSLAQGSAAIKRIAQILQVVIRAEVRLIRANYSDLIQESTDV